MIEFSVGMEMWNKAESVFKFALDYTIMTQ
jgi:hypothetical protein